MKIALLSFEYPAETGFGGIGTYTWYHARALAKLGHEVHVVAGSAGERGLRTAAQDGVVVHRQRSSGGFRRVASCLGALRLGWTRTRVENAIDMRDALRTLQRNHRFDVVEMPECGAEGMLVSSWPELRTVVRFHSPARLIMPFYPTNPVDRALCATAEQRAPDRATGLSSCSRYLADAVREQLAISRSIEVIANGIDVDDFDTGGASDFRARHRIPQDRPMILFSARLERRKGAHLCAAIAAGVLGAHDATFVMAGRDPDDMVRRHILPALRDRALESSFRYVGQLDLAGVREGIAACDVFLLPSLWENCPYACLEAMATGRAVVATDHGGLPELITHGENGMLARNEDVASYVQQIGSVLEDAALRGAIAQAARRTVVTRFRDVDVAQRAVELYAGVAS